MPLTTANGRLPALKTQPDLSPQRVQVSLRSRFNPIRNLTPENLASKIDAFKAGQLREFALLAETIEERDDVLKAVAPKRKKAVARHGFEILMLDDSAEAKAHKEALEYFYNHLSCVNGYDLNERGSFKLLIRQMMDAVAKRYAVHEIIWQPVRTRSSASLTAEFRFVPLWFFENRTGRLRFLANEFDQEGRDLEDGGWMVTAGEGLMIACAVAYMYKRLPLQDWLGYSEKFGFPGVLGKSTAAKDSDQWDNMVEAVEKFATDWAAVVNQSEMIELIEVKGGGANLPFPPLVERMDRAIATLWRGADLSTISKGEGLGASLQEDEGKILEEDDAALISETLNLYVDPFVIRYQFGPDVQPLAYLKIVTPQKQNVDQDLKVDDFLLKSGAPLAVTDTLERYNRSLPDASESLLTAPAPALASLPTLPNEATEKLLETARQQFAAAVADDLQPIRARLKKILQIDEPDILAARLRSFLEELPRLLKSINADPASAKVLEETLSAALLNGLTQKTK